MENLSEMGAGELENVLDEIHSRLARRYGMSKAEIAKLATKKYGDEIMGDSTDELIAKLNGVIGVGKQDVTDKMLTMEMIRDLRADRERQPPPQYYPQQSPQQPQQPMQQQNPQGFGGMPSFQEMMYMMMMPQMIRAMAKGGGGDDNFLETMYKMKMLMGDDGKGVDMEKLERMIYEERTRSDAKVEEMMNLILGKQEAERVRDREERWKKEMEQRTDQAIQMARHPVQPQDPYQATKQRIDEAMDMVVDNKRRMEDLGMVERPQTLEDKEFTKDMTHLKHQQSIETAAISKGLEHVGKGVDNIHELAKQGIDMMAKEQDVRRRQYEMSSPEERKKLEKQYADLGELVMRESGGGLEPEGTYYEEESEEVEEFSDADEMDAEE